MFWGLAAHWRRWRRFYKAKGAPYHVPFPFVPMLVGAIHFSGWIVAAVMVGQIWAPSKGAYDQALLRGQCGEVAFINTTSADQQFALRALNNNYTVMADEYARQCYVDDVAPT